MLPLAHCKAAVRELAVIQGDSSYPVAPVTRSNHSILASKNQTIDVYIFESSQMNGDLLSRAFKESQYGLRAIGFTDTYTGFQSTLLGQADVAVISTSLRDGVLAGFTLLKQLSTTHHSLRCVMLLDQDGRNFVVEAFRSGAVGVCDRNQPSEMLCKCIYCVHHGQVWVNSQQLHYLLEAVSTNVPARLTNIRGKMLLSEREDEITLLVTEGFTNREIATHLNISEHTVKNHVNHIFNLLGLSNRVELARYSLAQRSILRHPVSVTQSERGSRKPS